MPEQIAQPERPICAKCKRTTSHFNFPVTLDAAGLCVGCAPVTMKCDRGATCEAERVVDWRCGCGTSASALPKLRLCDHHDAIRAERLGHANAS